MDTAATVLWLLALAEPTDWAGTPVVEAYVDDAAQAVAASGR
jgi:hypothetical protein